MAQHSENSCEDIMRLIGVAILLTALLMLPVSGQLVVKNDGYEIDVANIMAKDIISNHDISGDDPGVSINNVVFNNASVTGAIAIYHYGIGNASATVIADGCIKTLAKNGVANPQFERQNKKFKFRGNETNITVWTIFWPTNKRYMSFAQIDLDDKNILGILVDKEDFDRVVNATSIYSRKTS